MIKKMDGRELELKVVEQPNLVSVVDNEGFTIGFYNTVKEAQAAIPAMTYNLRRGKVPARLLKGVVPPHCRDQVYAFRKNNRQPSNNNQSAKPRR